MVNEIMKKIVIIGAGASGLGAAYKLLESGKNFEITILEREPIVGGIAGRWEIDWDGKKYFIEKGYHHILDGDKTTMDFAKILGLGDKLHFKAVKQGFLYKGKVYGFSTPLEILQFPISLKDKIKLAKFSLLDTKIKDWSALEKTTAKDWVTKTAGKTNYEVFFERLIWNKFHILPDEISAPWLGTRLAKESSSFLKKFGWLEGGESSILYRLAEYLRERGVKIYAGVNIYKIENTVKTESFHVPTKSSDFVNENKKRIYFMKGTKQEVLEADAVVSTIAPRVFLKLVPNISKELKEKMEKIKYLSCTCLTVGLNKKFTDRYWINILEKDVPVSAIFCRSNLYEDSAPQGKSVMYIITYMKHGEEFWFKSDEEIKKAYIDYAERVFPGFRQAIEWERLAKLEWVEAIYDMDYENPPITDGNGFYFAGIYRFFPKIRNVASALESGIEAAEKILDDFGLKSP